MGDKPKPKKIKPWRIPDCDRWDGSPDDETLRGCRFIARFRVEFDGKAEHCCWRHLAVLLDSADFHIQFARRWQNRSVAAPVVYDLEFPQDRRAAAHGRVEYLAVEAKVTRPVQLRLL